MSDEDWHIQDIRNFFAPMYDYMQQSTSCMHARLSICRSRFVFGKSFPGLVQLGGFTRFLTKWNSGRSNHYSQLLFGGGGGT